MLVRNWLRAMAGPVQRSTTDDMIFIYLHLICSSLHGSTWNQLSDQLQLAC